MTDLLRAPLLLAASLCFPPRRSLARDEPRRRAALRARLPSCRLHGARRGSPPRAGFPSPSAAATRRRGSPPRATVSSSPPPRAAADLLRARRFPLAPPPRRAARLPRAPRFPLAASRPRDTDLLRARRLPPRPSRRHGEPRQRCGLSSARPLPSSPSRVGDDGLASSAAVFPPAASRRFPPRPSRAHDASPSRARPGG